LLWWAREISLNKRNPMPMSRLVHGQGSSGKIGVCQMVKPHNAFVWPVNPTDLLTALNLFL
jgi:hypothetical protein